VLSKYPRNRTRRLRVRKRMLLPHQNQRITRELILNNNMMMMLLSSQTAMKLIEEDQVVKEETTEVEEVEAVEAMMPTAQQLTEGEADITREVAIKTIMRTESTKSLKTRMAILSDQIIAEKEVMEISFPEEIEDPTEEKGDLIEAREAHTEDQEASHLEVTTPEVAEAPIEETVVAMIIETRM